MDYFAYDPDWKAFAEKNDLPIPSNDLPKPGPVEPLDIDFSQARPYQAKMDAEWAEKHPFSSVGYTSQLKTVGVDGNRRQLPVKVSCPTAERLAQKGIAPPYKLPVLFVTHGGGWVSGSHTSEEAWLLWPLLADFDVVIVSVDYPLAPEKRFPAWVEVSWDVLCRLFYDDSVFTSELPASCDASRVIVAGSSAGAYISAIMAQRSRDTSKPLFGAVLNVPVLCHYLHYPNETGTSYSYQQCKETFLGSREMATCWDTAIPYRERGGDINVSPLLGYTTRLAPHLLFVAGRDCLRDEGMLYAKKLEDDGVATKLHVYGGVPHNFAHYEELEATKRFREDLKQGLKRWI